jgi:signal transduction histidine kinase/CheY-like chemotaxis protein
VTSLGSIAIRSAASVYDVRKKVHGLATALGCTDISAVCLATAASQVCRSLAAAPGSGRIEAGLRFNGDRVALVLKFRGPLAEQRAGQVASLFSAIEPLPRDDATAVEQGVCALTWLPTGAGRLTPAALEVQRERFQQRSREELMQEVRAQNDALERHSAQLEHAVAERTVELRGAMEAADAANRAKSDFLSNMSHELRTPLNGVLGYAQILQRDPAVSPKQRTSLDAIHSCGQHLLTLINDVLDLSKIEAGRLELDQTPCDLAQLLKSVYDIVRPRAESRGVRFELDLAPNMPPSIVIDKTKLRQTIVNLAGNAVKFTEAGSVTLRARRDRDDVVIEVQDTGIGMTAQEASSVFDAFKQGEGGRKHGGTGLGLAISKRIIDAMGGSIAVESQKGIGSTFTVRLPVQEADLPREEPSEDLTRATGTLVLAPGQDIEVLVADDVPANRDILVTVLRDAGFRTREAANGQEALECLRQHHCPIALLDLRMPVMTGSEAVAAIRADPALAATKVIAVTASVIDFRAHAVAAGFDALVGKPVNVGELFQSLQQHLKVRFVNREVPAAIAAGSSELSAPSGAAQPVGAVLVDGMPAGGGAEVAARLRAALKLRNLTALNGLSTELGSSPATAQVGRRIGELVQRFDFKGLERLAGQLEAPQESAGGAG